MSGADEPTNVACSVHYQVTLKVAFPTGVGQQCRGFLGKRRQAQGVKSGSGSRHMRAFVRALQYSLTFCALPREMREAVRMKKPLNKDIANGFHRGDGNVACPL